MYIHRSDCFCMLTWSLVILKCVYSCNLDVHNYHILKVTKFSEKPWLVDYFQLYPNGMSNIVYYSNKMHTKLILINIHEVFYFVLLTWDFWSPIRLVVHSCNVNYYNNQFVMNKHWMICSKPNNEHYITTTCSLKSSSYCSPTYELTFSTVQNRDITFW